MTPIIRPDSPCVIPVDREDQHGDTGRNDEQEYDGVFCAHFVTTLLFQK